MRTELRKPLLTLHVWIGISIGLIFTIVALSGAVLIFRDSLERVLDPARMAVAPEGARLSLDNLVARARAAHPGPDLSSIRFWSDPTMPFTALFADKRYVHLNPYSGALLGIRQRYGEGFGWVEGLHKYLRLDPGLGENITGPSAFVYIVLLVTGLVIWWPKARAFAHSLVFRRGLKGRAWNIHLHKTLGFFVAWILLFSALSGITIAYDTTRGGLGILMFSKALVAPVPPTAKIPFAGFDAAQREIARLLPNARETFIPFPKKNLIPAYAIASTAPHANARSYIYLNPAGAVLEYTPYEKLGGGDRLYWWLLSLHTATAGGVAMKILLLAGTLSVPVLAWTGIASYFRRKAVRQPLRERAPAISKTTPVGGIIN